MISLHQLSIKNFMSIESAEFDFSDGGFFVFKGQFGAGKSTVLAAIALCWIEHRRGDSYKDFIKQNTEEAQVNLTGELFGHPIEFETIIADKPGQGPVRKTIKYKGTTYKNSECTEFLQSLDINYLQHIMFSMQGEGNITDLKPGDRTKLLKKIFDFEFASEIEELEKRQLDTVEKGNTLRVQLDMLNRRDFKIQELRKVLTPGERHTKSLEIERLEIEEQENQKVRAAFQAADENKQALKRLVDALATQKESYRAQQTNQKKYLESLQVNLTSAESSLSSIPNEESIQVQIRNGTSAIETFSTYRKAEAIQIQNLEERVHEVLQRKLLSETHVKAHSEGVCSRCGQPTHPENVPQMEQELAEATQLYTSFQAELKEKREKLAARDKQIYEAESHQKQLTASLDVYRKQRATFTASVAALKIQTEDAYQSLTLTTKAYEKTERDWNEAVGRWDQAKAAVPAAPRSMQSVLLDLKAQLSADDTAIEINKVLETQNASILKEKEETKKAVEENVKQQQALANESLALKEAQRVIEVDLPNFIIVKACGKIEKYINEFIQEVKPEMAVRLLQKRSGVDFFYSPVKGIPEDKWLSTKMASGFEKELLSIAWRVALARAYHLPILILDEIDSAANPQASEATYRTLARQEEFEQVFVISHKEEIGNVLIQEADKVAVWLAESGEFTQEV